MPLTLSRKVGERIFIGPDIILEVVDIFQGKVRLAFTAPQSIVINREEVYRRIVKSKEETQK